MELASLMLQQISQHAHSLMTLEVQSLVNLRTRDNMMGPRVTQRISSARSLMMIPPISGMWLATVEALETSNPRKAINPSLSRPSKQLMELTTSAQVKDCSRVTSLLKSMTPSSTSV